ncbi:hypothetical protein [Serinicoccus marinus]|uniref:hypothetical protein n=1 Tax=Serinicoccus marinus TaxID=247333 RepID=UPI002490C0F3|nr:hypothetical protein [Serinicoccus marinus]
MVGGDPARLNEAGNTMMTCAMDVQESDTALGGYRSFASSALGRADGSGVAAAFDDAGGGGGGGRPPGTGVPV